MIYPQVTAQTRRQKRMIALLYIDIDDFKAVNETLGHGAGDAMLKTIGETLMLAVRRSDVVARVGGDEFAILATNLERRGQAAEVAEKILQCFKNPFSILGHEWKLQASVGVSVFPNDAESFEELFSRADQAMCIAKATESHTWRFWGDGKKPAHKAEDDSASPDESNSKE
jgi:diguanylate cyclase (GGDEF)-like protein